MSTFYKGEIQINLLINVNKCVVKVIPILINILKLALYLTVLLDKPRYLKSKWRSILLDLLK